MDIVGPLPKSRSGKRFILVICDYTTRFLEAVPMKSIDAVYMLHAEELLVYCSRFAVPQEILTYQGTPFTLRKTAKSAGKEYLQEKIGTRWSPIYSLHIGRSNSHPRDFHLCNWDSPRSIGCTQRDVGGQEKHK